MESVDKFKVVPVLSKSKEETKGEVAPKKSMGRGYISIE